MSSKRPPPAGWATIQSASRFIGCSQQNLRSSYLPHLSPDDVQPGRPVLIRVAGLIELIVSRRVADATRQQPQPSADPLLTDGDSPALERYRMAKAMHAELDLEQRRGTLIDVGRARDLLGRWASVLRRAGERIGRLSPEAARIQNEALDECESIVREFGTDGDR